MADRFSPQVLARLRDPTRAGRWPPGTPEVSTGESGSEPRGIWIRVQIRRPAEDPSAAVSEARFQAFGCPVAIACASWLAEWTPSRTPPQIAALDPTTLVTALDLTPDDAPTAALALEALRSAMRPSHRAPGST